MHSHSRFKLICQFIQRESIRYLKNRLFDLTVTSLFESADWTSQSDTVHCRSKNASSFIRLTCNITIIDFPPHLTYILLLLYLGRETSQVHNESYTLQLHSENNMQFICTTIPNSSSIITARVLNVLLFHSHRPKVSSIALFTILCDSYSQSSTVSDRAHFELASNTHDPVSCPISDSK